MTRTKYIDIFKDNYVRNALLLVWEKVKAKIYMKMTVWLSTMEVFIHSNVTGKNCNM